MPKTVTRIEEICTPYHESPGKARKALAALVDDLRDAHTQQLQIVEYERIESSPVHHCVRAIVLYEDLIPDECSKTEFEKASGDSLPIVWVAAAALGTPNDQRVRVLDFNSTGGIKVVMLGTGSQRVIGASDIIKVELSKEGSSWGLRLAPRPNAEGIVG